MHHKDLTNRSWLKLSILEQMAHIGSEIHRAINWKAKGNSEYARLANERALELLDLTLADSKHGFGLKEIARVRELWLDFFIGNNQYGQTANQWEKYFFAFTWAARNKNL